MWRVEVNQFDHEQQSEAWLELGIFLRSHLLTDLCPPQAVSALHPDKSHREKDRKEEEKETDRYMSY